MIYTFHGVVDKKREGSQSTRSFVLKEKFEKYLKKRVGRYGIWREGQIEGCYLTIDDATFAAAEACLMAIKYDHQVMLLVNPWQIAENRNYYFHILNTVIDNRRASRIIFQNIGFDLEDPLQIKKFRHSCKLKLMCLGEEAAIDAAYSLAEDLNCFEPSLPDFSKTLSLNDLIQLKKAGVQIESHGWSHRGISSLNENELREDMLNSLRWIENSIGPCANIYAIPFGKPRLPGSIENTCTSSIFLADDSFPAGPVSARSWNRCDITNMLNNN